MASRAMRAVQLCGIIALLAAPVYGERKLPYWASIATQADQARMRTGPGKQFPTSWIYQRPRLPLRVIAIYQEWRKVEDPDGTQGWMLSRLLSPRRTALIRGGIRPLRAAPDVDAAIIFRAQPGVVGIISECRRGWCMFDVDGRMGYVQTDQIWGADDVGVGR